MRILLDTNLLVSHLLHPEKESPVNQILEAIFQGELQLLLPEELVEELRRLVPRKEYLAKRISAQQVEEWAALLTQVAEVIPRITIEIPAVTRDPKDDYLVAYALVGRADYLVTGDRDLLALEQVEDVRIVTPRGFWETINQE